MIGLTIALIPVAVLVAIFWPYNWADNGLYEHG